MRRCVGHRGKGSRERRWRFDVLPTIGGDRRESMLFMDSDLDEFRA